MTEATTQVTTQALPPVVEGRLRMVNTITVAPDRRQDYLAALAEVLPHARAQKTCVYLEVGEVAGQPGTFVLTELWQDGKYFVEQVLTLPAYQRYIARTEPLYTAPRTVLVLDPVDEAPATQRT